MPDRNHTPDLPRVMFIDHSGLPGGGQIGLARYLLRSRLRDVNITLLTPGHTFDDASALRGFPLDILSHTSNIRSLLSTRAKLAKQIAEIRPNIIVANSNRSALLLASLPRSRSIKRFYYMRDDLNPARKSRFRRAVLANWMMPRFDETIANSYWTASTIPRAKIRTNAKIAYPVSGISSTSLRETTDDPTAPLRVLSLSRVTKWKGIHVLLNAARILEQRGLAHRFAYTIAGTSTHEHPAYERQMWDFGSTLASSISFAGHVDEPKNLLASHDVLFAASISPEPFGQVVVQGMSHGLATIASNAGGPVEILENGVTGYLTSPGSAIEVANTLQRLLEDPETRSRISRAAAAATEKFTDSQTVAMLDHILIGD